MSKKPHSAKLAKGAKPKPKPAAVVRYEQDAAALRIRGGRRSFGKVDRLPREVRERVLELQSHPNFTYSDMQDLVLIETTPEPLRAEALKRLDAAYEKAHGRARPSNGSGGPGLPAAPGAKGPKRDRNAAYQRERHAIYEWAFGECQARELDPPFLLSDDNLSRMRKREFLANAELRERVEVLKWVLEERGLDAVKALPLAALGYYAMKMSDAVLAARNTKELVRLAPGMNVVANGLRAITAEEKHAHQRDVAVKGALDQVHARFKRRLKSRPELYRQVVEELDAATDEVVG